VEGWIRILGLLKLLVNITLSAEGQQLLVRHLPPALVPSTLEDVILFVREGGTEGGGEGGREGEVEELMAQICYLLRNLSFLRGPGAGGKASVLSSPLLLTFLVTDALTHSKIQIRFPATVALWSLLHHSEKSTAMLLRGQVLSIPSNPPPSPTPSPPPCLRVWESLAAAKRLLALDEKEGKEGRAEEEELMLRGLQRALENVTALLSSFSLPASALSARKPSRTPGQSMVRRGEGSVGMGRRADASN
jgi:hypothetical protein